MLKKHKLALVIAGLIILVSTITHWAAIWHHGLRVSDDSIEYIRVAYNLYSGYGLFFKYHDVASGTLELRPATHYPPVSAIVYGLPLLLGIPLTAAPTGVSLIMWPTFLIGIGWLTYRLSQSMLIVTCTIFIISITSSIIGLFDIIWSEPFFLTLLVFTVALLTGLPQRETGTTWRLSLAIVLLGLMMLTRYSGMFLYAGVVLWWSMWRLKQQRLFALAGELFLFGLGALPFISFVARNLIMSNEPFGSKNLSESQHTFADGVVAVIQQSVGVWLPVIYAQHIKAALENIPGWMPYLLITGLWLVILGAILRLWQQHQQQDHTIPAPFCSPILALLAVYLALYTLAQPFVTFNPMDGRDAATVLCLIIPWLAGVISMLPHHYQNRIVFSYVSVNVILWVVVISYSFSQPATTSHAPSIAPFYTSMFFNRFHWPNRPPHLAPRTNDLRYYQPELVASWQHLDTPPVIISNEPLFFAPYPDVTVSIKPYEDLSIWLQEGHCSSPLDTHIVMFDWHVWHTYEPDDRLGIENPDGLATLVEQKCPALEKTVLEHSIIYHLNDTAP